MNNRVLIVEDNLLIAMDIEDRILDLGLEIVGIASNQAQALRYADKADIALVDVQLTDGQTGPLIAAELAGQGTTVIFMTGNPEMVANSMDGAVGVLTKPVAELDLVETIRFACDYHAGRHCLPPTNLKLFNQSIN